MRWDRYIVKKGKNYPLYKIEAADITAGVTSKCRGFAHGGKAAYLPDVIMGGGLVCSDTGRSEGAPLVRDKRDEKPNGTGAYFRFVRNTRDEDRDMFHACAGVGSTGGVIYFLPLDRGTEREFITFGEHDKKYIYPNPDASTLQSIVNYVYGNELNQSEIAFFGGVRLSDIPLIYVEKKKAGEMPEMQYEKLYNWIVQETNEHPPRAASRISHPIPPEDCRRLLVIAMAVLGYSKSRGVITDSKSRRWYKFTRSVIADRIMAESFYESVEGCDIVRMPAGASRSAGIRPPDPPPRRRRARAPLPPSPPESASAPLPSPEPEFQGDIFELTQVLNVEIAPRNR